jgi:hypothetical protein
VLLDGRVRFRLVGRNRTGSRSDGVAGRNGYRVAARGADADKRGRNTVGVADADAVSLADPKRLHALGRDDVHGIR